jgi:hypothetical protein
LRSSNRAAAVAAVLIAGSVSLGGCTATSKALGLTPSVPDEFRVVAKAPLIVPPDYGLRPPVPGEPRPQELQPESRAREALLGRRASEARSEGEKLLASKAGADRADPLIRYVVDDEYGDITYKDKSFADKVLFWRKDAGPTVQTPTGAIALDPGSANPTPVDAAAEQKRIAATTGGGAVVIKREAAPKRKLPGL